MIARHRRKAAAQWAGLAEVPAVIRELDDNQAIVAMVDSNLQREISRMSAQAVGGAVGKNEKRNKNSIFMPIRKI